ncbi:pilus assembly protein [Chloroflexales bacterium ZM16-3]|nr:pilus assembly protein [Chloroflexales bacterium ZM16-3]
MFRRRRTKRSTGQALVEFALAATLIFTLLSAAVDLGLIFFTLQGLRTAAQEGATFGSHPVLKMTGSTVDEVDLNYDQIVDRIRQSGGSPSIGFVDLHDLNNNGRDDWNDGSNIVDNPKLANSYIYIERLMYPNGQLQDEDGNPVTPTNCPINIPRRYMRNAAQYCYIRVTVKYDYKFIFPLAPVFGDTITLHSSYMVQVRSSFIG